MHDLNHNEDRPRGTYEFPFEFHHIDHTHPRYVMSYHWQLRMMSFLYTVESFIQEFPMIVYISALFLI